MCQAQLERDVVLNYWKCHQIFLFIRVVYAENIHTYIHTYIWGVCVVTAVIIEKDKANRVQILDEAVYTSHCHNPLMKGGNDNILPSARGKSVDRSL